MILSSAAVALGTTATGVGATILAAAAEGIPAASYVQGGGSAAAVAGLIYVARLIAKGELVPRAVKDAENELHAGIMAAAQREAVVLRIAEQQQADAADCRKRHDQTLIALSDTRHTLEAVAREMAYWREMRDRGTRREDRDPHNPRPGDTIR